MKTAQQAYEESLKNNFSDINLIMQDAEKVVGDCAKMGLFVAKIGGYAPCPAERAAIELEKLGYNSTVVGSGRFDVFGSPICDIIINWKYLPSNTREAYND